MKHLKRKFLLLVCTLAVATGSKAENVGYAMRVTLVNGKVDTYIVADHPSVVFDYEYTTIQSSSVSAKYATDSIANYTFADIATSIKEVNATETVEDLYVKFVDGVNVHIRGINPNAIVRVYSLNGQLQGPDMEYLPNGVNISLSSLPTGTYIINIDNKKSFKVLKR